MKNYIQRGDTITVPAPAALKSGDGVQIGKLFGIAFTDAASGEDVALAVSGVYALPKSAGVLAVGDEVEWSSSGDVVALATGTRIGVVIEAAQSADPNVKVKLWG